jgi:hypothetical protein
MLVAGISPEEHVLQDPAVGPEADQDRILRHMTQVVSERSEIEPWHGVMQDLILARQDQKKFLREASIGAEAANPMIALLQAPCHDEIAMLHQGRVMQ